MTPAIPLAAKAVPHILAAAPGVGIALAVGADDLFAAPLFEAAGNGAVLVGIALIIYRIVLHATSRADAVYRAVIAQLESRNHELAQELAVERELRMSLERAGISERRSREHEREHDVTKGNEI